MFTGIISHIGSIESAEQRGDLTITIACDLHQDAVKVGDSVACNGCCLTVTRKGRLASGKLYFSADLSQETVSRTAPGQWVKGAPVNLECSLRMGDSLDGHMVSGHVDGVAVVRDIMPQGDSHILEIEAPQDLARFIAEKGSVTLNGVSLTVNEAAGVRFRVNIIPHTWVSTTLGQLAVGDGVNMEIDLIARYVARLLQPQA
jgi:riboflavin synthase